MISVKNKSNLKKLVGALLNFFFIKIQISYCTYCLYYCSRSPKSIFFYKYYYIRYSILVTHPFGICVHGEHFYLMLANVHSGHLKNYKKFIVLKKLLYLCISFLNLPSSCNLCFKSKVCFLFDSCLWL